jgi:hypothetical protein
MSLTKLSLAGKNLTIPGQGELESDIPTGDGGKTANLFLQCTVVRCVQVNLERIQKEKTLRYVEDPLNFDLKRADMQKDPTNLVCLCRCGSS